MIMRLRVTMVLAVILSVVLTGNIAETKKRKKVSIRNKKVEISPQMKMAMVDLSQLEGLSNALRQAGPPPTSIDVEAASGNVTTGVSATKQGPCTCGHGVCSCCSRILLNFWRQKACVNVTYDPDEFEFTAKVVMNDRLLYKRTVSGKNPSPVCVPVPRVPAVRACVRFYNIYFQGRNVHACVNMEGKFQDTTLFKVGMDCLRLGANGVALVRPEDGGGIGQIEFLPEDTGDSGEDYDGYDDYDDGDDDDDLFDY